MATKKTTDNVPALRGDAGDAPAALIDRAWLPGADPSDIVVRAIADLSQHANNGELPVERLGAAPAWNFDEMPICVMDTTTLQVDWTIYDQKEDEEPSRSLGLTAFTQLGTRRVGCGAGLTGMLLRKIGVRCRKPRHPDGEMIGSLPDENGVMSKTGPIDPLDVAAEIETYLMRAPTLVLVYRGQREPSKPGRSGLKEYEPLLFGAPARQVWESIRAQLKAGA